MLSIAYPHLEYLQTYLRFPQTQRIFFAGKSRQRSMPFTQLDVTQVVRKTLTLQLLLRCKMTDFWEKSLSWKPAARAQTMRRNTVYQF